MGEQSEVRKSGDLLGHEAPDAKPKLADTSPWDVGMTSRLADRSNPAGEESEPALVKGGAGTAVRRVQSAIVYRPLLERLERSQTKLSAMINLLLEAHEARERVAGARKTLERDLTGDELEEVTAALDQLPRPKRAVMQLSGEASEVEALAGRVEEEMQRASALLEASLAGDADFGALRQNVWTLHRATRMLAKECERAAPKVLEDLSRCVGSVLDQVQVADGLDSREKTVGVRSKEAVPLTEASVSGNDRSAAVNWAKEGG